MADSRKVLIVGATSAIAQRIARHWATQGAALYLVGRSDQRLRDMADDLGVRGASKIGCRAVDFRSFVRYDDLVAEAVDQLDGLDTLLVAHGELTDQARAQVDVDYLIDQLGVNLLSALAVLTSVANLFEARGSGTIVVLGSVAGDRGRRSNYAYGTAKGALETFTQGLRNRLSSAGVHVLLVKPGLVDTPMTAGLKKNALYTSPDRVARDVHRALDRRKDVIYTPFFWRFIMLGIRLMPEPLFKIIPL